MAAIGRLATTIACLLASGIAYAEEASEQVVQFVAPAADAKEPAEAASAPTAETSLQPVDQHRTVDAVVKFVAPTRNASNSDGSNPQPSKAEPNRTAAANDLQVVPAVTLLQPGASSPLPPADEQAQPRTYTLQELDAPVLSANLRPYRPLSSVTLDITMPEGLKPNGQSDATSRSPSLTDLRTAGAWPMMAFHWAPTNMRHRPLYFEQVNMERYGYSVVGPVLQPVVAGAHFFAVIPALPYKMTVDCPRDCIYTLGHYRPGSCGVPRRWHMTPWSWKGAVVESAAVGGLILLIP